MQAFEDVKASFRLWTKNVMAFIITMIGVALLLGIILLICGAAVAVILAITTGTDVIAELISLVQFWYPLLHGNIEIALTSGFLGITLPIIIVYSWIFGSIYKLCDDVTAGRMPTIGGPFSFLRENILTMLLAGVLLGFVSIGPTLAISLLFGQSIAGPWDWIFGIFSASWYFIVIGLTSMFIPAIIDGHGLGHAFRRSLAIVKRNHHRVFGAEFIFLIVLTIMFGPLPIYSVVNHAFNPSTDVIAASILALAALGVFITGFLILPWFYITMTKIYNECKNSDEPC